MSNEVAADENVEKEENVIGLGCSKESFTEHEEVERLIEELMAPVNRETAADFRIVELNWQRFSFILDQYQEQPHLIDPHLDAILCKIIHAVRKEDLGPDVKHIAFRYLYFIAKVRGYKVVARHLTHEVADLEPLLCYLESQDPMDQSKWETHYGLLLWFSMVAKIPFHLQRFDSLASGDPVITRILNVCKKYLAASTAAQDMAVYLTGVYITRPDVRDIHLTNFIQWILEVVEKENVQFKKGAILALAAIFKHGQRDAFFMESASSVLLHILRIEFRPYELSIVKKPLIKLIQRLGLIFLKPRVASWRYQRGSRSLLANLTAGQANQPVSTLVGTTENENEDDDVPEEIEQVLDEILKALGDKSREVQYSAAKGIGRLTNRLSKDFADQVVDQILTLFSPRETEMAWHGGCLALAELARRGLLLPHRLSVVLPVVEQALLFDELRGNYSVGAAVRDAACYLCWALARAFDPDLLKPFVHQLAKVLVTTTVFDREVNCRRAASSAFQEHVGRQGTFPHGIDILTTCDYFAVGLRKNSYLNLSLFVAQYEEYRPFLVQHLVKKKIMHWDPAIRQLTSETLHKLTLLDPVLLKSTLLDDIIPQCAQPDLHLRLGSILSAGQIINSLCKVAEERHLSVHDYLGEASVEAIIRVCGHLLEERFWRSHGGDQMRVACSRFVEDLSRGHFPIPSALVDRWLNGLSRECLSSADSNVQQAAVPAVSALIGEYFQNQEGDELLTLLKPFLAESIGNNQQGRVGNALLLGSMPRFILMVDLPSVVHHLCNCAVISDKTLQWAESRKNALASLATLCNTVGIARPNSQDGIGAELLDKLMNTLIGGMDDYTVDNRGDIGAIVRESAMSSIQAVIELVNRSNPECLKPYLVQSVLNALLKQATEQIRRTRLLAASVFSSLIHCDPPIPHIAHKEELCAIVPPPPLDVSTEKECFELWVQVMRLDSYRKAVVSGFVSSIGSLTESLVKSSSTPFVSYLRHLEVNQLQVVAEDLLDILRSNCGNVRLMPYIFNCFDHLCSSGCLDPVFKSISEPLFALIRTEMSSGSKTLKLLISSIDLYCHLLRGNEAALEKSANHLLNLLINRFPRVRKTTAAKLYEALLTLTDINSEGAASLVANQDEILAILSDTDWDEDVESLKPIKNRLRQLFLVIPSSN